MASTMECIHVPLASREAQAKKISTTEPDGNVEENTTVKCRKRKASVNRETNKKRHQGSSKTPDTCEPGSVFAEDVRARPTKRKASPDRETQRKRPRGSCHTTDTGKPSNVSVDKVRVKVGKRKASTVPEIPEKRQRVDSETKAPTTHTSKPQEVLVEAGHKSHSGETSKKREEDSELRQSSSQNTLSDVNTSRADFEAKYQQLNKIGEGGFGSVYAGVRITDSLPVAIKHIHGPEVGLELKERKIPLEVVLMQKVSGGPESIGRSAAVSLLDWYYLDDEPILVMERPDPSMDLSKYLQAQGGSLGENEAKTFMTQLVEAAIEMHRKGVFHRDITCANILVEVGSSVPRIRMIDFGCGRLVEEGPPRSYRENLEFAHSKWHVWREAESAPTTVWQLGAVLYRLLHGSRFHMTDFALGHLSFSSTLSQDCRDFLHLCLTLQCKKRGTLQQLQLHPWLK